MDTLYMFSLEYLLQKIHIAPHGMTQPTSWPYVTDPITSENRALRFQSM